MTRAFLILSPPRCGTAWLSHWLTHEVCGDEGYSIRCYHELFGDPSVKSAKDVAKRLGDYWGIRGNADCGNMWFVRQLKALIPDLVLIGIHRDPIDVVRSLRRVMPPNFPPEQVPGFDLFNATVYSFDAKLRLDVAPEHKLELVDFDDLFTRPPGDPKSLDAAEYIWRLATDDEPFDLDRWLHMRRFNIQLTPEALEGVTTWATTPQAQALWETRDK